MSSFGNIGITAFVLLIAFILIAVVATSIIVEEEEISEENIEEILDDVLNEVSTYIQIKDTIGKYNKTNEIQKIEQIAIMIKPIISNEIDITQLSIKICNGKIVKFLNYGGNAGFIGSNSLFKHKIWNNITENDFGLLVTHDKDRSIVEYNIINDNTDMVYLIINLPTEFKMKKGNILTITLFPSTGIQKIITIEAPIPINQIVSL